MRLIQFIEPGGDRRVGVIKDASEPEALRGHATVRDLALSAFRAGRSIEGEVAASGLAERLDYEAIIAEQRILLPLDHPEPSRCVLGITGLTHLGSASTRDLMHAKLDAAELSDSMKMFKWGVEGGKPPPGTIGAQSEWAYKGDGRWAVAPGQPIASPAYAEDGGEEAEVVGLYVIADNGAVLRVGYALGNEFSDHVMERRNYLFVAHSKLRPSSYGPELLVGELPRSVSGTVRILRERAPLWAGTFLTGEDNMSHTIANLEQHHFKYANFRQPGDVHVYFFGASVLSCAEGISLQDNDVMEVSSEPFGKPLVNPLVVEKQQVPVRVLPL